MALFWGVVSLALFEAIGSPVSGAAVCPDKFQVNPHHKSCVWAGGHDGRTWREARKECAKRGSVLVTVDSPDMVQFMDNWLKNLPDHISCQLFWVTYNDIWTSGQFRSAVDGSLMTFNNFYNCPSCNDGQPNDNGHEQNCVLQNVLANHPPSTLWQDKACDYALGSVACEIWPGDTRTRHFRKVDTATIASVKLRQLYRMRSVSRLACSAHCSRDFLCDAFAFLRHRGDDGRVVRICRLLTLDDIHPDFDKKLGGNVNVKKYALYIMEI